MRRVPPRDRFITEHALLRVHASIFNIDHASNLRERGREHSFHGGYLGNHHEIIQRGVSGLYGNENVYVIITRESRRSRKFSTVTKRNETNFS